MLCWVSWFNAFVTLRSLIIQFHSVFAERYEMDWFIELRFTLRFTKSFRSHSLSSIPLHYIEFMLLHLLRLLHSVIHSRSLQSLHSSFTPLCAHYIGSNSNVPFIHSLFIRSVISLPSFTLNEFHIVTL